MIAPSSRRRGSRPPCPVADFSPVRLAAVEEAHTGSGTHWTIEIPPPGVEPHEDLAAAALLMKRSRGFPPASAELDLGRTARQALPTARPETWVPVVNGEPKTATSSKGYVDGSYVTQGTHRSSHVLGWLMRRDGPTGRFRTLTCVPAAN